MPGRSYWRATGRGGRREVDRVTRPAAPRPGPPGVDGEVGLDGSMLRIEVQIPLPSGANANASDARPVCVDTWTARSTIAWSGRSPAFGVRIEMSDAVRFDVTGVVSHCAGRQSLPVPDTSA